VVALVASAVAISAQTAEAAGAAGSFVGVSPTRLLDTRDNGGCIPAGSTRNLTVTGTGGVAADASAVVLNVTVTQPSAAGYLTVFPAGGTPPLASNLNFVPGQTVPNAVTVKVSTAGMISILNSAGCSHVIVDVVGHHTSLPDPPIDRQSRSSVRRAFTDELLPALMAPIAWSGSTTGCAAGTTSAAHQTATLRTVNWYRRFVGLTPVTFDPTYSAKAQQAALMMQANNDLNHFPPGTWACYTTDGAQAAGSSNLALGTRNGPDAINLYIHDPGADNTEVGHRRWVLDPQRVSMGSGTTATANALWVFGAAQALPSTPAVVAWPADGYFPNELEPGGRWSLSVPGADFGAASVTVTDSASDTYATTIHPVANGYGQNTLVWQVEGLNHGDGDGDRDFFVTVTGISGWIQSSYSYTVKMFDAA